MRRFTVLMLGPRRAWSDPGEWALAAARVFTGLTMAFLYGAGKFPPPPEFVDEVGRGLGFAFPAFFAWSAGAAEFLGGMLLAVGALTRVAACFLLITMVVAAYVANAGEPLADNMLAHLYGFFFLVFLLRGAGVASADAAGLRWLGGSPAPARAA